MTYLKSSGIESVPSWNCVTVRSCTACHGVAVSCVVMFLRCTRRRSCAAQCLHLSSLSSDTRWRTSRLKIRDAGRITDRHWHRTPPPANYDTHTHTQIKLTTLLVNLLVLLVCYYHYYNPNPNQPSQISLALRSQIIYLYLFTEFSYFKVAKFMGINGKFFDRNKPWI